MVLQNSSTVLPTINVHQPGCVSHHINPCSHPRSYCCPLLPFLNTQPLQCFTSCQTHAIQTWPEINPGVTALHISGSPQTVSYITWITSSLILSGKPLPTSATTHPTHPDQSHSGSCFVYWFFCAMALIEPWFLWSVFNIFCDILLSTIGHSLLIRSCQRLKCH